jgi:hypothetical protein
MSRSAVSWEHLAKVLDKILLRLRASARRWYNFHRNLAHGMFRMELLSEIPSEIPLPVTPELLRKLPMLLWRRAPTRPTRAARMLTLRRAQCFAGLARALDENPDLGRTKSLSESATPT